MAIPSIPATVLATLLVSIALRDNPFAIQIASIIGYTGGVFFFVFCDAGPGQLITKKAKGTKGFSLGEKAVRQKLPLFLRIHGGVLVLIIVGVTGAFWLRRHTLLVHNIDSTNFDLILVFIGFVIQFAEAQFFRRLLGRALKDDQRSSIKGEVKKKHISFG